MVYKNMNSLFLMVHLSILIGQLLDLDGYELGNKKITFCHYREIITALTPCACSKKTQDCPLCRIAV